MKKTKHTPKQKSRQCPFCKSVKTQRVGEFALCLDCHEPFHHDVKDEQDSDSEAIRADFEDSVGGTDNFDVSDLRRR